MGKTSIEWTDVTWNPLRGCTRVSEGCRHCYAETVAARFSGPGQAYEGLATRGPARWTGNVALVEKHLADPLRWREPKRIFVNSMSDLFHDAVPDEWIDRVFAVMALSPRHTFQVLTKRPERMRAYLAGGAELGPQRTERRIINRMDQPDWIALPCGRLFVRRPAAWPLPNVWIGVSVEDQATADARIPLLLQTPAAVRFVSYEPALAGVDFTRIEDGVASTIDALRGTWEIEHPADYPHHGGGLEGGEMPARLDWIIVGGESGPGARPFDVGWARSTIAQCRAAGVAVFAKQLGRVPMQEIAPNCDALIDLRDRKGGDMEEWPADLRVREFPEVRDA